MGSRRVITGEAVALDLRAASLITRGGSLLIDVLACWLLFGAMVLLGGSVVMSSMDPAMQAAVGLSMMVLCLVIVPITVETLTRGRSLGKLVFGLRTVRDDGGAGRLGHSVSRGRAGVGQISITPGLAALITARCLARV